MIAVRREADEPPEERLAKGLDSTYMAVRMSSQDEHTTAVPGEELAIICLEAQAALTAWHLGEVLRLLETDAVAARERLQRMMRVFQTVSAGGKEGGVVIG